MCSRPLVRLRFPLPLCVAAFVLLGACGKKGDPMPAPRTIPKTTADLSVRQRGFEVVLELTYPKSTVAGLPYAGLDEVVLYALERQAPAAPTPAATATPAPADGNAVAAVTASAAAPAPPDRREFEATAREVLRIGGAELASAISGDRITLRFRLPDPLPSPSPLRFYAVRTHAVDGESSDLSNFVSLLPLPPLAAPGQFLLIARKDGVELSWQAPAGEPIGYRVYRRPAALTGYGAPIAMLADPATTRALDSSATYGERYVYAVTAVAATQPLVEGAISAEREILYEDRFAPVAPGGLTALPGEGSVRLVWEAVAEGDVAGYVVERADPGADFHRVTESPIAGVELTDSGLGSGFVFRYRVAAIDRAGNLGEPSAPVSARVP